MIGAFIQVNLSSRRARSHPLGYVIAESGCWEWVGARSQGYGSMDQGRRVHRLMWEQVHGPIPSAHELHHRCGNRGCVNPAHLALVTRRTHPGHLAAVQAAKIHCCHGHPFSPENTYRWRGQRHCRTCMRAYDKAYRLRLRQRSASRRAAPAEDRGADDPIQGASHTTTPRGAGPAAPPDPPLL